MNILFVTVYFLLITFVYNKLRNLFKMYVKYDKNQQNTITKHLFLIFT